jgi:hypothetical protein
MLPIRMQAGFHVDFASPNGGHAPFNPTTKEAAAADPEVKAFWAAVGGEAGLDSLEATDYLNDLELGACAGAVADLRLLRPRRNQLICGRCAPPLPPRTHRPLRRRLLCGRSRHASGHRRGRQPGRPPERVPARRRVSTREGEG